MANLSAILSSGSAATVPGPNGPIDCIVYSVTNLDPNNPTDSIIIIPPDAITDRMQRCELATQQDAVVEIVKEHYYRLNCARLANGQPDPAWMMPADLLVTIA